MEESRRVSELVALYELEPDIRDVFVEGPTDRGIIKAFLNTHQRRDVSVYAIEAVHIDADELFKDVLPDNNRSRIIYLAAALERLTGVDLRRRVVCIADADLDHARGVSREHALLIFSDYTSMELYAHNGTIIQKFIEIIWLGCPRSADSVLRMIAKPLRELFAIRVSVAEMSLHLRWVSPIKSLEISRDVVVLNVGEFLRRYLNQGVPLDQREEIARRSAAWLTRLPSDQRLCSHGEDFIELLLWTLRRLRTPSVAMDALVFRRTLLATFEMNELAREAMFRELLARLPIVGDQGEAA